MLSKSFFFENALESKNPTLSRFSVILASTSRLAYIMLSAHVQKFKRLQLTMYASETEDGTDRIDSHIVPYEFDTGQAS